MIVKKILIFLMIMFVIILHAQDRDLDIKEHGIVEAIRLYSLNYHSAQFLTMETICSISNKENFAKAETSFAQYTNTIFELNVFFKTISTSDLNVDQQFDIIQSLSLLSKKILFSDNIGVGNVELSLYISQFISGMFFNIISVATEEEHEKILRYIIDFGCLNSEEYIEKILTCNELNSLLGLKTQNNISSLIYQIIEFDDTQQNNNSFSPVVVLNEQLKKNRNIDYPYFNKYKFASSLIQSHRSVLMCRIPNYISQVISMNLMFVKDKNEMLYRTCETNFSKDELNMLYFYYEGTNIEKAYKIRDEVRSSISYKGKQFIVPIILRISNR